MLGLTATAVVALGVGAGIGTIESLHSGTTAGNATAVSTTVLSTSQIAARVDPGLVDVTSTLGYQQATAMGTGIVLTSNGEVLTNNHVIDGATSISVRDVGNGKTYKATVVGYDKTQDIAVLQLSGASGLTTASTGNSSTVGVGDKVVGLGNAGGVGGTPSVATGQVTALNQSITASDEGSGTSENLTGLIETNADIQPGDSGGPLVNSYGQVVGVDTAASSSNSQSDSGSGSGNGNGFGNFGGGFGSGFGNGDGSGSGNSGSGNSGSGSGSSGTTQAFSIPINEALSIASQIEAGQSSSTVHIGATAFLGVQIQSSDSSSSGSSGSGLGGFGFGFGNGSGEGQSSSGVTIAGVENGTPAANAGLTAGDEITSVAGQSVSSDTDIASVLEGYHPGDKISISWIDQSGQSQTATVTLASGPAA
jgi:S1-C subfamily serine protease